MAKQTIHVQNIKKAEELAKKLEIIIRDIYRLIDNVEIKKTDVMGNKPKVVPLQDWFDTDADQKYIRRPDGTDKPIG